MFHFSRLICFAGSLAIAFGSSSLQGADAVPVESLATEVTAEPRRVLAALDIGESELHFFRDGETVQYDSQGTLLRLLYRVPGFSVDQWHDWQAWQPDWEQIAQHSTRFRGAVCRLAGIVANVTQEKVPEDLRESFPFDTFYRVDLRADDATLYWTAFVQQIPAEWQKRLERGELVHERAAISGVYLHLGDMHAGRPSYVFVGDRAEWYPNGADDTIVVDDDIVWLAEKGVDASQLLQVSDRSRMSKAEREVFYQLLAAVDRSSDVEMSKISTVDPKVSDLLAVGEHRGRLFTLSGRARRAVKVGITDESIRRRFGIEHYYEVDVFVDSDVVVRFASKDSKTASEKVFDPYPFVFCVRELPPGMPIGESIYANVSVNGVYFKQWAYRSEYLSDVAQGKGDALQFSPLLIGKTVIWHPDRDRDSLWGTGLVVTLFGGVAMMIGWMSWRFVREDRRMAVVRKRYRGEH